MNDALSQDDRIATLTTPLGDDVLTLNHFRGTEALSELNAFTIEASSLSSDIDFDQAIGHNCAVTVTTADGSKRYFNGILVEAEWVGAMSELYIYKLLLRPWPWLLAYGSDCRIYAKKTVPDIIKQIFDDRGLSDYRDALTRSYPQLEYCVQYRESDLNFVSRLMEEYGVYYFFEHTLEKHTLVLADSKSSHKPAEALPSVVFRSVSQRRPDQQCLTSWSIGRRFTTGKFTLNDYDYSQPRAMLLATEEETSSYPHGSAEHYDYPGRYTDREVGAQFATTALNAHKATDKPRFALGSAASLFPGCLTTLTDHPLADENTEYLVARCSHNCGGQNYRSGAGSNNAYTGDYILNRSNQPYSAPSATRKPVIPGPQSALVVGKEGEEIDVDELGRILVQFYWDRKQANSRRVRVAQSWAGATRGALFLPRIGDEVIILHEEGDPDRPLVVGSVYNGANVVHASLPEQKAFSGILTKSSKNSDGWNMLLFDDTASAERVKIRAQKDLVVRVQNDERRAIGNDQNEAITGNVTRTVGKDEQVTIASAYALSASAKITLTVGASSLTIDPSGITLKAPSISFKADASFDVDATAVSLNGHATVAISGVSTEIGEQVAVTGALATPTISWGAAVGTPPAPA